jgi:hypothetical protein
MKALILAVALLTSSVAHAGGYGYNNGYNQGYYNGYNNSSYVWSNGNWVGPALAGAVVGGLVVNAMQPRPQVVYVMPPGYVCQPVYIVSNLGGQPEYQFAGCR